MKKLILLSAFTLSIIICSVTVCHAKTVLTYVNTVIYEEEHEVTQIEVYTTVNESAKKEKEEGKIPFTGSLPTTPQNIIIPPSNTSLKTIMANAANSTFRK